MSHKATGVLMPLMLERLTTKEKTMSHKATTALTPTPKTQNVDTTQIIVKELQKIGDPLPVPIAKARPSGLYTLTIRRLQEQGKESYTEAEFRNALRQVIRELTDTTRDKLTAAERRHTSAIESDILAAATEQILQEQGNADTYTPDEYLRAVAVAKRRTGLDYGPVNGKRKTPAGTDPERGRQLHALAEVFLARDGKVRNPRGELVCTGAEYAQALQEAHETLTTAV
jgi:hypothetical protein